MTIIFVTNDDDMPKALAHEVSGAHVTFVGSVRPMNHQKAVAHLFYEAHEKLAEKIVSQLIDEARDQFGITDVSVWHRLGLVNINDDAVFLRVNSAHRREAFLAARFLMDELKRVVPIWKKEVYRDGTHAWGGACMHVTHDREAAMRPVMRALAARKIRPSEIAHKKVVLIGAGGLGCPLAINLSALGIRELAVYDDDVVEESNLLRQFCFRRDDVGQHKAMLLKRFIEERNFSCRVHSLLTRVTADNCAQAIGAADLVIDATDNLSTKNLIKLASVKLRIPLISASVHQFQGEVQCYVPTSEACLSCHLPTTDYSPSCSAVGVLNHTCSMIASVAAERALMILSGESRRESDITLIDPANDLIKTIRITKDPHCIVCGRNSRLSTRRGESYAS